MLALGRSRRYSFLGDTPGDRNLHRGGLPGCAHTATLSKGNKTRQSDKISSSQSLASVDSARAVGSSGARMALQRCPKLGPGG